MKVKKQEKKNVVKNRIKKATKEKIENVEAEVVNSNDVRLTVPYRLATKLNQDVSLRKSQNNTRKQFAAFIEDNFDDLVDCYDKITDSLIKARIFLEVAKLVIPRPKEYDEGDDEKNTRNKLIARMFGGKVEV